MINQIYPCLWFDNNAKEAADFYCSVFQNAQITAENPIVVNFEVEGQKFMCLNGGPKFQINSSISFFVSCNLDEIEGLWAKLSAEGMVLMPLNTYSWSEKFGWCQDKYGVNWQLMIGKMGDGSQKIVPSLAFTQTQNGKAEKAINFYASLFQNSEILMISRYQKGQNDVEGNINHAQFKLNNQIFAAMESSMPHMFTFNEAVSFVVECENQAEIDYFWNHLTEGGEESMCGWLKDQFGVSWQIVPKILGKLMSDPEKSPRVIQAFLQMQKFDIQTLLDA